MGGGDGDDVSDDLYDRAVRIVAETQRVSVSYLQRRSSVGYNRAPRWWSAWKRRAWCRRRTSRSARGAHLAGGLSHTHGISKGSLLVPGESSGSLLRQ
jgi:hypothetical protein